MTRLPLISPDTADGAAATQLTAAKQALGGTPNMVKAMANSPALLQGYLGLSGALASGALQAGVREQLALLVAEFNGCSYCLSAHSHIGEHIAKVERAELELARNGTSDHPHSAAVLALAGALLRGKGSVETAVLEQARAKGVTDAEIAETVGHVALNVLTNYFNILSDVEVDWPVTVEPGQAR